MSVQAEYQDLQPIHHAPTSFFYKYLWSTDHKVIARQFLWGGLLFLLLGGLQAMFIRWQWAYPGEPVPVLGQVFFGDSGGIITPGHYTSLFTSHGLIMIFWAITPMMIGAFGNLTIPLLIGARDMAFPRLNAASFWTWALSGVMVLTSFIVPYGTASGGWTTYPPVSGNVGSPGWGQSLFVLAIFTTGSATIMGAINYTTTTIRLRAPGMTWMRMPLTVWGQFLTAVLNVLFVPVLAAAAILLLMDRWFGTQFFVAGAMSGGAAGDPILFQHLFWIFGHPEVYILILPAWGFVGDFVSYFSRKPHYWYRGSVYAMSAVTILSAVVYGHHMYTTGMAPLLGKSFMLMTLIISVPAEILFLNWLHTMYHGSMRRTVPMMFALGTIFVFGSGGLTGLPLATITTDLYLHATMFVVGHFHLTMAAAAFLGTFGAIYYWMPKLFGTMANERLGQLHFWFSFIGLNGVFIGQMIAGYAGQPRRLYDPFQYAFTQQLLEVNQITSWFAFALFGGQIFFVINWFMCVFGKKKECPANPWGVGTLEWTIPNPPEVYNYKVIPTVYRGPYEFANPEVKALLGRDWLGQSEIWPPEPEAADDEATDKTEATAAGK
jgi:cytochrome c oxidase subunit 1